MAARIGAARIGTTLYPAEAPEWTVLDAFCDFEERMWRLCGEGMAPFGNGVEEDWSLVIWSPVYDNYETDNEVVVKAALPDAKREDLWISLDNKGLTVRGERRFEAEKRRENYQRLEHSYGEFSFI